MLENLFIINMICDKFNFYFVLLWTFILCGRFGICKIGLVGGTVGFRERYEYLRDKHDIS
jgi:hypothetical protein